MAPRDALSCKLVVNRERVAFIHLIIIGYENALWFEEKNMGSECNAFTNWVIMGEPYAY